MPDEKLNDINDVGDSRVGAPKAPDPSKSGNCWCGATYGPLWWNGRLWCEACLPADGVGHTKENPRLLLTHPALASLARIESLLEQLLAASIARAAGHVEPAAPVAPMPLQPGDRASYNGRRGVLRSIGVAGTGILYDDGRYALLTNAMAAQLVRE